MKISGERFAFPGGLKMIPAFEKNLKVGGGGLITTGSDDFSRAYTNFPAFRETRPT